MQPLFHWIRQGLSTRSDPTSTETVELTTLGPTRFSTYSHAHPGEAPPDTIGPPPLHQDTSATAENGRSYGIVTDHAGHSAITASEEELDNSISRWLGVAVATFAILLFVSTNSPITLDNNQSQKENTLEETFADTLLKETILRSTNNPSAFDDSDSPQSRALKWMQSDDGGSQLGLSHQRILARYALAVLYFSTGGHQKWKESLYPFLTSQNECEWGPVGCNSGIVDELSLSNDGLTGSVPEEIRLLSDLRVLDLSDNYFTGSFPWDSLPTSQLEKLDLSYNHIPGTIPWDDGDWAMVKLKSLNLCYVGLVGTLPSFLGKSTLLEHLDVSNNGFYGTIPSSLGGLKKLVGLRLQHNHFSGQVPSELASLPTLERMLINGNRLSGDFESFCSDVLCEKDCFDSWYYTDGDDWSWDDSFNGFVFPILTDSSNHLECSCCPEFGD